MNIRTTLFLATTLLCLPLGITSCSSGGDKGKKTDNDQAHEKKEKQKDIPEKTAEPDIEKHLPILARHLYGAPELKKELAAYMTVLQDKAAVKSEEDILKLINMRDELVREMSAKLGRKFAGMDNYEELIRCSENLEKIGIRIATAEGMFGDFIGAPLLEGKIKELGSPAFVLYMDFLKWSDLSIGGEYPYLDLEAEMKMVRKGEQLESQHADSKYYKEIKDEYHGAMLTMTQIHALVEGVNSEFYLLGNYNADLYPYMTEIEQFTQFISQYSDTKLSQMTEKILDNLSYADFKKDSAYIIVTSRCPSLEACQDTIIGFLKAGKDIPYQISHMETGSEEVQRWAAYRFYADREIAEKELVKAEAMHPGARIIALPMKYE